MNHDRLITLTDLAEYGLTAEDVERKCPGAVERRGLHGERCWRMEDLAPLFSSPGGEDSPP
jgi:hypothetical protein